MAKGTGGGGSRVFPLLVLLALLGGGGAWNYQRNLAAEEAMPRPYKGYSDSDLEAMSGAYTQEIEQYTKRWEQARGRRMQASTQGLVGDAAQEFERVQGHTSEVRALKRDLAERQVTLDKIAEELDYRRSLGKGWQLHLRRLTTF
jgi:hypothetical protein